MSAALGLLLVAQLNSFEFSSIESPQIAGDSFRITVVARDPHGGIYPYNGSALLSTTKDGIFPFVYPRLVTFSNGVWQQNVIVTLADSLAIRCIAPGPPPVSGQSNVIAVFSGPPKRLLPILPGEEWAPGSPTGRMPNSPFPQDAGRGFDFDVYLTDAWHNLVRFRDDSVRFRATDSFAVVPDPGQLANGQGTFPVTFRRAGQHQIVVLPMGGSPADSGVSSPFTVRPGSFRQLLLLLPGETALPGDTTTNPWHTPGKSGRPVPQFVRTSFEVTVYACDTCWNPVTAADGDTALLESDFEFEAIPGRAELRGGAMFSTRFANAGTNQNVRARMLDGQHSTYSTWFDVRALATLLDIRVRPGDTVPAGETAYVDVTMRDANNLPITAAPCRFSVVVGSGVMLDTALLSDTLGRVTARFLCSAANGAEHDTIKVSADVTEYVGIYVDRPDAEPIGAYPNPFGFNVESATIHYFLPAAAETRVAIYDPFGNEVRSWSFSRNSAGARSGINRLHWDGRSNRGRRVANGIYVIQVSSQQHTGIAFWRSYRLGVVW